MAEDEVETDQDDHEDRHQDGPLDGPAPDIPGPAALSIDDLTGHSTTDSLELDWAFSGVIELIGRDLTDQVAGGDEAVACRPEPGDHPRQGFDRG